MSYGKNVAGFIITISRCMGVRVTKEMFWSVDSVTQEPSFTYRVHLKINICMSTKTNAEVNHDVS